MKADESIPGIYARALLESAEDQGVLHEVVEEVSFLAGLLDESRDLRVFLENPRLENSVKHKVLEDSLASKLSDVLVNFLLLVVDKGRQSFLRDIFGEFESLYDKKVGRVRAVAVSAVPLAEGSVAAAREALAATTGKEILLTNEVEPSILAGLIIRFDGMVADGSLKTALEEIRSDMMSLKFGSELIHED